MVETCACYGHAILANTLTVSKANPTYKLFLKLEDIYDERAR